MTKICCGREPQKAGFESSGRKIYTRRGDKGETSLLRGGRVPKYYLRIELNGMIDELNSWIGYVRSINRDTAIEGLLGRLQPRLTVLCADIAVPQNKEDTEKDLPRVHPRWAHELEAEIDRMEKDLDVLNCLILPGGSPSAAALHLARTTCRRAELLLVCLQEEERNINPDALRFLNRLSDYLFILAQWANFRALKGSCDQAAVSME